MELNADYSVDAFTASERVNKLVVSRVPAPLPAGTFRPIIDAEYELADIQAGHEYMETNASTGKIVVAVNKE